MKYITESKPVWVDGLKNSQKNYGIANEDHLMLNTNFKSQKQRSHLMSKYEDVHEGEAPHEDQLALMIVL
jgi:hypothetical protein